MTLPKCLVYGSDELPPWQLAYECNEPVFRCRAAPYTVQGIVHEKNFSFAGTASCGLHTPGRNNFGEYYPVLPGPGSNTCYPVSNTSFGLEPDQVPVCEVHDPWGEEKPPV